MATERGPLSHLADENVFRVEQVSIALALDHVDHARLQVEQQSSRDVVVVVCLVEEDVFPVVPLPPRNAWEGNMFVVVTVVSQGSGCVDRPHMSLQKQGHGTPQYRRKNIATKTLRIAYD